MAQFKALENQSLDNLLEESNILIVQSKVRHDLIITLSDSVNFNRQIPLYIPKVFPVVLTEQTTIRNLKNCSDLHRLVGNGTLSILDKDTVEPKYLKQSRIKVAEMAGTEIESLKSSDADLMIDAELSSEEVNSDVISLIGQMNIALDPKATQEDKDDIGMTRDGIINKLTELDLSINEATRTYVQANFQAKELLEEAWG